MNVTTLSVTVPVDRQRLFQYLADINNMPEWATEFCRNMYQEQGRTKMQTPMGNLFIHINAHPDTGVVDWITSPDGVAEAVLPGRVTAMNDQNSVFVVTFHQPPGVDDAAFDQQKQALQKEMQNIVQLFS